MRRFELNDGLGDECVRSRVSKETSSPKVSDESQFHHPPQVPSCKAHQLPSKRAIRFRVTTNHILGKVWFVTHEEAKGALRR